MMGFDAGIVSIPFLAILVSAGAMQTGSTVPSTFEVASVKLSRPNSQRSLISGGPGSSDPGQYYETGVHLLNLLTFAFETDDLHISSKASLEHDAYDVVAKVPAGTTKAQFHEMLRNLLIARFHIKLHHETREVPGYELSVARTGVRLRPSVLDASAPYNQGVPNKLSSAGFPEIPAGSAGIASHYDYSNGYRVTRTTAQRVPILTLIEVLRAQHIQPIVDRTGLTGAYDFHLEYSVPLPSAPSAGATGPLAATPTEAAPYIMKALLQQLGLQLTAKKVPLDFLVIDSFDRTPSED